MGEFDSTVKGRQSKRYAFTTVVPDHIATALSEEVISFASERPATREYSEWSHELPIWSVTERANGRVNCVRMEALVDPVVVQSLLSFSPDAYEDDEMRGGLIRRSAPSADEVSALAYEIPFRELKNESSAREAIHSAILKTLERASLMKLVESHVVAYPSPYRLESSRERG